MSIGPVDVPASNKGSVRLSQRALRTSEQPISYLMELAVSRPEIISLAAGLVDQDSLPVDETSHAVSELFGDQDRARRALQYGTTQGHLELRELLVEHLERLEGRPAWELGVAAENVVITTGSQQLLELVTEALVDPGDLVLVGAPDYFVYLGTLGSAGARAISVPMDERGLIPEALDETLGRLERAGELGRVKLLYCASYFQNPTGITLAAERRPAVLEVVKRRSGPRQIFILEDGAYRELWYSDPSTRSIRSYDPSGEAVILTQTFSKSLSPGLKIGYAVLPPALLGPVLQLKGSHDFGSANFNQYLLAEVLRSGRYHEHVSRLRKVYSAKLAAMLGSLDEFFRGQSIPARWTSPGGGLYVWLTLPEEVDTGRAGRLFGRCIERGVLYVPGEYCYGDASAEGASAPLGGPRNTMRLSFGVLPVQGLREGVARLASAVADTLCPAR